MLCINILQVMISYTEKRERSCFALVCGHEIMAAGIYTADRNQTG